ncbi:MAG: hypothetical protein ACYC7J_13330 [Syntrophales bacterium]
MELSEIKNKSLWPDVAKYFICSHCRIVDSDIRRMERGHQCPTCRKTSDDGRFFFDLNILTLIDLIHEAFHTKSWKESEYDSKAIGAASLSVLLFFCSLREVLLDNLIISLMAMHNLPSKVSDRLNEDNRTYSDKMTRLLPSLIGLKSWNEAIEQIKVRTGRDHKHIDAFMKEANKMRNEIIHEGDKLAFQPHMKKACLENIPQLINLYVDFQNTFIHPVYFGRL